jgi:uncharacterized protein
MVVGVLSLDLLLPASNSLKDKRQVLRSLLDRLHNEFNVSAAEVGDNDVWRRAQLGVACVANERSHADAVLQHALRLVSSDLRAEVLHSEIEWW